jgi:hypothetical protein
VSSGHLQAIIHKSLDRYDGSATSFIECGVLFIRLNLSWRGTGYRLKKIEKKDYMTSIILAQLFSEKEMNL